MIRFQLTLAIWYRPLSQHPLPPARHHPHLLIPSAQTINQEKSKSPEMRFSSQQIELYCLGLLSWPTYTESRAKRARFETQP